MLEAETFRPSEDFNSDGLLTFWHVDFFKQDHGVPVRAPPTEAPQLELDESSGHQPSSETSQESKGQEGSELVQDLSLNLHPSLLSLLNLRL